MQQRTLHTLRSSALGLGCMGMTFAYAGAERRRSVDTLHRALELGITMFDTADIYGPETNEQLVGPVLAQRRDHVVIATKFGARSLEIPDRAPDGRPEYVRRACDASLRRLGIDRIDLYYQHRVDPQVPIEETVGAMADAVTAGKARYIGLSEVSADTLRRAQAVHPIAALQSEYSLWERDVEESVLPACRELGVGFVPYSPLGRGFLTGDVRRAEDYPEGDYRRLDPRYQGENFDRNWQLVEKVRVLAERHGATPAQIALAWLLHQGEDVVPIPGMKRRPHLEANAAAVDIALSPEDLEFLDAAAPPGATAGLRYTERFMAMLDR